MIKKGKFFISIWQNNNNNNKFLFYLRYRRRIIDDDDEDLRHMESSFDQIEREEDYSRRQGLQEDIADVLREQSEKKQRLAQMKKRPRTAA